MSSKRQYQKEKRKRQRLTSRLIWGGVALVVLGIIGYALWGAFRPASGQSVAIMPDSSHVPEDVDPGPYNSDPPTSGRHYENSLQAGFYHETDLPSMPEHPEGLLVHSLEHGYVIFWYNCQLLDEQGCSDLKARIQQAMDGADNLKVIAFPWDSIDVPVVLTSWGRMQSFDEFNVDQAVAFVENNRNRSPEPNAP